MKTLSLLCLLVTVSLFIGCKKTETASIPVLTTVPVTMFTERTATSGGKITAGAVDLINVGVCVSTNADPTTSDLVFYSPPRSSFVTNIDGLDFKTLYHVRAYATSSAGTGYGDDVSFTTAGAEPIAVTDSVTNISANTAKLYGAVNSNFLSSEVTFEYGTSTAYGTTVVASPNPVKNNIPVRVSVNISDLEPGTTYHFRVAAVNDLGSAVGNDLTFTTETE
jgi:hypothetical protein